MKSIGADMRAHGFVALALATGLALPGLAAAGTAKVEAGVVVFVANPGEINKVTVSAGTNIGPGKYIVRDTSDPTPQAGCVTDPTYGYAVCDAAPGASARVDLGDGADEVFFLMPGQAFGGPGDDVLKGREQPGQIFDGGAGNDTFDGDSPLYCIDGTSPSGSDTFIGGDGVDTVDYADTDVGQVTVTLDGVANDGAVGEGDNVGGDVENVVGTGCALNDITGSSGPNGLTGPGILRGGGGDDVLTGSSQNDQLFGGDGNDRLIALFGNDSLDGGAGDDFLEGGFDDDILTGGPGLDSHVGDESRTNVIGTGNDRIFARDGVKESISCGPGSDVAELDATDEIPVDTQNLCEVANRGPAGGGGTPTAGGRLLSATTLTLTPGRRSVRVKVSCLTSDGAGCNGVVRLRSAPKAGKKVVVSASTTVSIAPSRSRTLTMKLNSAGRALVRRKAALRLTVVANLRTSAGAVSSSQTLRVRR